MQASPSPTPWSTVAALPDYLLLAQTRQLARHEQALQILVLDHLREIEARRLHLTRGYGSLFDYVVHELDYTAAAAWRRIKAMRLCAQTGGARELLQDGSLNLSNAAQLQNLFERSDRSHGRPPVSQGTDGGPGGARRDNSAPGEPAPAASMHGGARDPAPGAGPVPGVGPVLDAAAREKLVKQAAGKSTREVQQMLAEVDPELAQPSDRMRALGGGRWELKAAVDGECRHGLEKLQMLLSHRDPHLTLGGLVARLVRDGLHRYDPARPPKPRRRGGGASVDGARTPSKPVRRDTETMQRNVVRAKGSDVERLSEVEPGDTSLAADRDGLSGASAAKRHAQTACDSTKSTPVPDDSGRTDSAANRSTEAEHGSASAAPVANGRHTNSAPRHKSQAELGGPPRGAARDGSGRVESAAKRSTKAERDGASPAAAANGGHTTSAPKYKSQAELGGPSRGAARDGGVRMESAAKRPTEAARGGASPVAAPDGGGHAASPAKCESEAELGRAERAAVGDGGGLAVSAPKRDAEAARGGVKYTQAADVGGRVAVSPAKRRGQAGGAGRDAQVGGGLDRRMGASGRRFEADRRDAERAPGRGGTRFPTSLAKRLAYAAGHGSEGPAERSPALQRHLAALRCLGALPDARSRYIPAVVRREVWRRDQGRCSYVDRHSGRRCGSRYRLELDHIVPFALGGGAEPSNLRLRCGAHHRLRHAQRHVYAGSEPSEARCAPVFAVDPNERGQTVGSYAAINRAGA